MATCAVVSATFSGLSVPVDGDIWVRWNDTNISGNDTRRGIEENEPEGAGRVLAWALVDGVADPGGAPATGLDQLQVEALVVPGLLRHVGKASLGPHGRDAIR